MVNFTILAGGYSSFIASYLFNSEAGVLQYTGQSQTNANPSWVARHLTNPNILYAVNEDTDGSNSGGVQSFTIGKGGALTAVGHISTQGDAPAFMTPLTSGGIAAMNYNTGNGIFAPTTDGGLQFGTAQVITFPTTSEPANVSHPHMAFEYKDEIFVPDLLTTAKGQDKVWRVGKDASGKFAIHGDIPQPTGSGPRHMRILNDNLYIAHELASSFTAQPLPAGPNGTSEIFANLPTQPEADASLADPHWAAGEILVPEPNDEFPTAFAYVSNRNTGTTTDPRGDTVAIFQLEPEVKLVAQVFSGVQQIRGIEFGGEKNEYVVLSGVVGTGGVAVFERTNGGANLTEVARDTTIPTRTGFVWGSW
ncbi:putative isomerase YbhE [Peniophora sp. CONT]|nr:putative isomerase YbhE [Peniophora sp. CONT]